MLAKIITQPQDCLGLRVSQNIQTLDGLIQMHQPALNRSRRRLRAIRNAKFAEERIDMRLNCGFGNFQFGANFFVASSAYN